MQRVGTQCIIKATYRRHVHLNPLRTFEPGSAPPPPSRVTCIKGMKNRKLMGEDPAGPEVPSTQMGQGRGNYEV